MCGFKVQLMISKFLLALTFCFSCTFSVEAQCDHRFDEALSDSFVLHKNIVYGSNITSDGDVIDLTMDIFEPSIPSEKPRPVMILAHGGGFFDGSKEMAEVVWFCEDFAKRGFVTASINYRKEASVLSLIDREKMIKAVIRATEDYKAAIRFFYRSAEESNPYDIDANYIIVGGTSAGSIAAMHAVFMDEFYKLPSNYQGWVQEIVGDTTMIGNSGNAGYPQEVAGIINISGAIISPIHLEDNADIPIFSAHNQVDLTIPYAWGHPYQLPFLPTLAGSLPIHKKMKEIGGYSKLYAINEINHVPHTNFDGTKNEEVYNTSMRRIADFLRYIVPCTEITTDIIDHQHQQLTVYPNPVKNKVEIKGLPNAQEYIFSLMDISGKVLEDRLVIQQEQLDLGTHSNGLYLLIGTHTKTADKITGKIIIQN